MSWYRRSSVQDRLQWDGGRRRSRDLQLANRRCSLNTFHGPSRSRTSSKANVARDLSDDDIDLGHPPVEDLPKIKGYEDITFESTTVFPPSDDDGISRSFKHQNIAPASIPQLTEEEARAALMEHVTSKCTYVRSVAREMVIRKMDSCPGYQYTLESFTEMRQVSWSYEPYTGDTTSENSFSTDIPPEAWDVPCPCPSYFHNHVTITEVPNTTTVRTCHSCGGIGRRRCNACNSSGWENCHYCHGDGLKVSLQGHRERCYVCVGSGRKKCWKCSGDGMAACKACGGTGQIRCYISLTVTWTNHMEEHVEEPSTAIRDKLENASGHLVLEEEMHQISPIGTFPEKSIIEASSRLLEKHRTAFSSEKVLMQRHRVKMIPVTSVSYQWKSHVGLYFVYGIEKKIYAPDYPQASCCVLI